MTGESTKTTDRDAPKRSLEGFRKIGKETGGSLVQVRMWNQETDELRRIVVDDYAYQYPDGPFMTEAIEDYGLDELEHIRDAPVDGNALRSYNVRHGIVFEGALIGVVRGRKVPIGTTGAVTRIRKVHDRYGRHVATYADLMEENGARYSTNIANLKVMG